MQRTNNIHPMFSLVEATKRTKEHQSPRWAAFCQLANPPDFITPTCDQPSPFWKNDNAPPRSRGSLLGNGWKLRGACWSGEGMLAAWPCCSAQAFGGLLGFIVLFCYAFIVSHCSLVFRSLSCSFFVVVRLFVALNGDAIPNIGPHRAQDEFL